MKTKKLAEMSMLAAVALIIFIVESRIPTLAPIPGMKLGLANIITVYAVYRFKPSEAAMILAVRLILGAVFAGNLSTLLYSAAGAVFHNTGQILAACLIMRSSAVFFYYPFLIVSGIIAGLFTGFCAMFVLKRLSRS